MLANAIRGTMFFSGCLASFTQIGYAARRLMWQKSAQDFSGQTWVVTGASGGIGRAIAEQAVRGGATVFCVARNAAKLRELESQFVGVQGAVRPLAADLSLMAEVERVAELLAGETIDVLVNNVGVMINERESTAEGLEKSFATNLLGHYLLTETLRATGALSDSGTVINMASGGLYTVPLKTKALQGTRDYNGTVTYAYHKRAMAMLNAWWRDQGVRAYVMHPGWVATDGVATAMPVFQKTLGPLLRDAAGGADTALWLAASKPEQNAPGSLWFDRGERAAHYFPGTEQGDDIEALLDYLASCLHSARHAGEGVAAVSAG